jgi:hypothetical protein
MDMKIWSRVCAAIVRRDTATVGKNDNKHSPQRDIFFSGSGGVGRGAMLLLLLLLI